MSARRIFGRRSPRQMDPKGLPISWEIGNYQDKLADAAAIFSVRTSTASRGSRRRSRASSRKLWSRPASSICCAIRRASSPRRSASRSRPRSRKSIAPPTRKPPPIASPPSNRIPWGKNTCRPPNAGAANGRRSSRSSVSRSGGAGSSTPPTPSRASVTACERPCATADIFPAAAGKALYPALMRIERKWQNAGSGWHDAKMQLAILFGERFRIKN